MFRKKIVLADTLFIHVPKVAGSSIEMALYGSYGKIGHKTLQQLYLETPDILQEKFIFAFVRSPYDRLMSAYYFLKSGGRNHQDEKWAFRNLSNNSSFEEFVFNLTSEPYAKCIMEWMHFRPQSDFLTIDGKLELDFIGKYEKLEQDFKKLTRLIEFKGQLPLVNKTECRASLAAYTPDMESIVSDLFNEDFELFGYA